MGQNLLWPIVDTSPMSLRCPLALSMTEQTLTHFPLRPGKVSTGLAGQKATGSRTKDAMTSRNLPYLRKMEAAPCTPREQQGTEGHESKSQTQV